MEMIPLSGRYSFLMNAFFLKLEHLNYFLLHLLPIFFALDMFLSLQFHLDINQNLYFKKVFYSSHKSKSPYEIILEGNRQSHSLNENL